MHLETERLILRKLKKTDAERMFLMDSHPEVMKYIGVPPLSDILETENNIEMIRHQYAEYGIGRLAVIEKKSGLLIGWSGLKLLTQKVNGYKNVYDLGYRFLPEYWGKGYASESAKASLDFGFNGLKIDIIYAHAHSENHASNHILEKLGFRRTGEFSEPDGICFWYELNRKDYL